MSAIHPGNLHGTGSRTNKTRYHYARQRVQDAQKGKLDESTDSKKEESELKSASNSTILVVLVVLICVTWGVAATAYFGIVDYKGLIARSSKISAADATEYASSLYPFQYEAVRHPLRSIGSTLTAIDDAITNLFTFTKAPFQIIDKRRQATVAPVRRMKKFVDLSKRDVPVEKPQKEPVASSSDEKSQEQVDVEKPKTPKAPKEPKQAESPKPPDDKPESPKEKTNQEPEKSKDVSVTLNLHLIVGQDDLIDESHLVSDTGSILRIGTKSSSKVKKNPVSTPKCDKTNRKELFFALLPINKANVAFCNGNPPIPRLVLEGMVQNPASYSPQNLGPVPPTNFPQEGMKLIIESSPVDGNISPDFSANISRVTVATKKLSNHRSNSSNPLFNEKLVVDTKPLANFGNPGNFDETNGRNENCETKFCGKPCFFNLKFLNKKLTPKNGKNHKNSQKIYSRITLPNVVPKNLIRNSENSNSGVFLFFGQKVVLSNPTNKYFLLDNPKNENLKVRKNPHFGQKLTNRSKKLRVEPSSEKRSPHTKFVKNPENSKETVPLMLTSHCVVNVRYFVERKMIFRSIKKPIFDRILRNMCFGDGMRFRRMSNPCSQRMIRHYMNHDTAKMMQRKVITCTTRKRIRNIRFLQGRKMIIRSVIPPPARRVIQRLSWSVTSQKILSYDLRSIRSIIPPPSRRIIRKYRYVASQKMILRGSNGPSLKRVIQNAHVNIDRKKLFRGTTNPSSLFKNGKDQELNSIERKMSNPTLNRVVLNLNLSYMGQRVSNRKVMSPNLNKVTRNTRWGSKNREVSVGDNVVLKVYHSSVKLKRMSRAMSNPTSNRVILKIKKSHMGRRMSYRRVMNPSLDRMSRNSRWRKLSREVSVGGAVVLRVGKFVRAAMEREGRLLFSRLVTTGSETFQRQISMPKLRELPRKRQTFSPEKKLTPREKLKRKFSRMFDRTCDVINAVVSVVRKLNIFERTYKILPKNVRNSLEKAKNVTVISKILDITLNTTLNDVIVLAKTSGQKISTVIKRKVTNFYNFLNQKPSFRSFFTKLSKFAQKMQGKYEKVSDMISKNFIKLQYNQKFLTSVLITLSVVGLYHIFYSCLDTIMPYRQR